ncbi:lycopene cyclase family protein [Pseudonocardia endophytica]|uniref:Lycopene cyclase (CrtL-type) n=1 Tax=Pseudonocardia endophytica TaxID=401976 RepID=A0A4R1I326_PSEEN|nr:lycopene cyclase family protein [Pseudonocardia endophytica]TCK24362.1 lycopene cyclase (CrtL-type) [Pseudonocardia endophytica]
MPPSSANADVLVLGGGPAGRALAGECAARGLRTTLVDPAPDRPWRATYGAWDDDLPGSLPDAVIGSRARARAFGTGPHLLGRRYAVLDTRALRSVLDARMDGVHVVAARGVARGEGADTTAGRMTADVVVDATGAPRRGNVAEQTAYGVVAPEDAAAELVAPGEALFMDWRPDHGHDRWPTFLYAVPYGDGTVLLEETSLARRPGLGLPELRARLRTRLRRWGIEPGEDATEERVRFPVDTPRAPADPIAFGAATPLVHPASGFSVATALTLAPRVAEALKDGLDAGVTASGSGAHLSTGGPGVDDGSGPVPGARSTGAAGRSRTSGRDRAVAAARAVLWSPAAVAVHQLRRHGLRTVLGLPPELVPSFFEAFFRLPEHRSRAFLSGRDDLPGTVAAMAGLFRHADPAVRARLLRSAVWPVVSGTTPAGDVPRAGARDQGYR